MKSYQPEQDVGEINSVQAAIRQAGGVRTCARYLGVSERLLYVWMKRGHLRGVAAERVLALAARSGIQAENLVGRVRKRKPASDEREALTEPRGEHGQQKENGTSGVGIAETATG
jgi:hypothetical protein